MEHFNVRSAFHGSAFIVVRTYTCVRAAEQIIIVQ